MIIKFFKGTIAVPFFLFSLFAFFLIFQFSLFLFAFFRLYAFFISYYIFQTACFIYHLLCFPGCMLSLSHIVFSGLIVYFNTFCVIQSVSFSFIYSDHCYISFRLKQRLFRHQKINLLSSQNAL